MKFARLALILPVLTGWPAAAQSWDSSGNGMLQGTYYFREVLYALADSSGDLSAAGTLFGNMTFNGNGGYTMTAIELDSNNQVQQPVSMSGTYSISASGYGFLSNPVFDYTVYGLVSQGGIFVGSATESGSLNEMFVAAPLASPAPTNASFKGSYTIYDLDLTGVLSGGPAYAANYTYQLNPDGAGNLGTVNISGYFGGGGSSVYTQSIPNAKYAFSNGGCNLAFPTNQNANFISGQRFLYISSDGNFVFGGSPVSLDMFVGVKNPSAATNLSGSYYEAGIDENLGSGSGLLDTYYGSFNASGGSIVDHQRTLNLIFNSAAYGYTFSDVYTVKANGTYTNGLLNYQVGAGGTIRIGWGVAPYLALNVAVAAPSFSGTGVYLYPNGVLNAASSAPFTAGVAPGELLTLYGTNLAPSLLVAPAVPLPSTLNGVQVSINGLPAPIYYVSPSQISVIVPYAVTGTIAQIQVTNNNTASNTVSMFVNKTAPGIFTVNANGLGYGKTTHLDGTPVTPTHPAVIGETVSVYLTGLGTVNPLISDGSAGPVSPLSQTVSTITVDVDGTTATVGYAGLAPQLAALYQINFTIPAGLAAGDHFLDIGGPDSYSGEALISVAAPSTSNAVPGCVTPTAGTRRVRGLNCR